MTGSSSEDRRKFLQRVWSHILRRAKSTILSGDSVRASRLLGLRATVEQLPTIFSSACKTNKFRYGLCNKDLPRSSIGIIAVHPFFIEQKTKSIFSTVLLNQSWTRSHSMQTIEHESEQARLDKPELHLGRQYLGRVDQSSSLDY